MEFLSLTDAAKKLHTPTDKLRSMAAKGQIVLSVKIPPDVSVRLATSNYPDAKGYIEVSETAALSHLDIPAEEFSTSSPDKTPSRYPVYRSGYLESNHRPVHHLRLKPLTFRSDHPDSSQPLRVKVYGSDQNSPTLLSPHDERKPGEPAISPIQLDRPFSTELINELSNIPWHLVCLKQGQMVRLVPCTDSLLISTDTVSSLRKILTARLPSDEMTDIAYPTMFMQDMNQVAREMYALAIQNNNIYPKSEVIRERLLEMPSFKRWAEKSATDQHYQDLPNTAAEIIRPKAAQGKGNKKIDPTSGYLSERFKILIDASNEFGPKFKDAIKPSIDEVTKWLLGSEIGKDMAARAAPIIWPTQERSAGRRRGVKNSTPRRG